MPLFNLVHNLGHGLDDVWQGRIFEERTQFGVCAQDYSGSKNEMRDVKQIGFHFEFVGTELRVVDTVVESSSSILFFISVLLSNLSHCILQSIEKKVK